MDSDKKLFIAFGASQTAGFISLNQENHPYTINLKEKLPEYEYVNLGISGETLVDLEKRLKRIQSSALDRCEIICILGGTNDLGYERCAEEMEKNIDSMIQYLEESKMKNIMIMTIPTNRVDENYKDIWNEKKDINERIRKKVKMNDNLHIVDLAKDMDWHSLDKSKRELYWSDFIHYTKSGYNFISQLVYNTIITFKNPNISSL